MTEHRVEAFIDPSAGSCGWQCLTCGDEETGFDTFRHAEQVGELHAVELETS